MAGRWPPNLLLTHSVYCAEECHASCPVRLMDEQSGQSKSPKPYRRQAFRDKAPFDGGMHVDGDAAANYGDQGGASRFFPIFGWSPEDFWQGG